MNINLKGNNSMSKMMWAGRFSKEVDSKVNDFNSSISFDARMYKHDIKGSIAHATMLGECGIIDPADSKVIIEGLNGILSDIENGTLHFDPNAEDIHMFVEAELTARIGDAGKRNAGLHSFTACTACYIRTSSYGICSDADKRSDKTCRLQGKNGCNAARFVCACRHYIPS